MCWFKSSSVRHERLVGMLRRGDRGDCGVGACRRLAIGRFCCAEFSRRYCFSMSANETTTGDVVQEANARLMFIRGEVCRSLRAGATAVELNALLKAEEMAVEAFRAAMKAFAS